MSVAIAGPTTCFGCGGVFPEGEPHDNGLCNLAHPEEAAARVAAFRKSQKKRPIKARFWRVRYDESQHKADYVSRADAERLVDVIAPNRSPRILLVTVWRKGRKGEAGV